MSQQRIGLPEIVDGALAGNLILTSGNEEAKKAEWVKLNLSVQNWHLGQLAFAQLAAMKVFIAQNNAIIEMLKGIHENHGVASEAMGAILEHVVRQTEILGGMMVESAEQPPAPPAEELPPEPLAATAGSPPTRKARTKKSA